MKTESYLRRIMRDSVRLYFAPLRGAIKGIRSEWRQIERDARIGRTAEQKGEPNHE